MAIFEAIPGRKGARRRGRRKLRRRRAPTPPSEMFPILPAAQAIGRAIATGAKTPVGRAVARAVGQTVAFEAGRRVAGSVVGGELMPTTPVRRGGDFETVGDVHVVKTWTTQAPPVPFARLSDGRIAVQRRDGTIKVYRPKKHIVVPNNPRINTLLRAHRKTSKMVNDLSARARKRKR